MSTKDYFPAPHPKTHRSLRKRYKKKRLRPLPNKNAGSMEIKPNDNKENENTQ